MHSQIDQSTLRAFWPILAAILLGVQLSAWIDYLPPAARGHADFRAFYVAGLMLRDGQRHSLYDYEVQKVTQDAAVSPEATALPFYHLAYEAVFFAPFSWLPYTWAYWIFMGANICALIVSLHLLRKTFAPHEKTMWVSLCFLPLSIALLQGQDSILLLLIFSAATLQLVRDRHLSAGLLTGLGLFKLQLILPIGFVFLLWKRRRFVAGLFATSTLVGVISVLLIGDSQTKFYVRWLLEMGNTLTTRGQFVYGIMPSRMPNLRGLVFALFGHFPTTVQLTILIGLSLALLAWFTVRGIRLGPAEQFALAVTAAALVSHHILIHDWSVLLVPLFLAFTAVENRTVVWKMESAIALVLLAPLLLVMVPDRFFVAAGAPLILGMACVSAGLERLDPLTRSDLAAR